jgi:hypothetical protein
MTRAADHVHPRTLARGTRADELATRVTTIVYAAEDRIRWIENELARGKSAVQTARNVAGVVDALVEDPAPRPQILVIDVDALSPGELLHLHAVREQGWTGKIVALGRVPAALRTSLKIARVIPPPYVEDALCDEIVQHRLALESKTTQIPLAIAALKK